jgi:TonB family protein
MGSIYKVRHRLLDELRIVKMVRRSGASEEMADRFVREARAATRLRHPNVANIYDFAVGSDGKAYIVMEYIEGWDLLAILRGYGPPPLPLTIEIAHQALRALSYLHRFKILHRDISPDNLMLTRDVDGHPLVKLIDLGIAKALEEQPDEHTATGLFLGKPRYGSPEGFNGEALDERSDLYSFSVVLYELLTGCCPIAGTETSALMAGHLFLPPRAFSQTDPGGRVPEDLRALVLQALAKRPDERVESAEEFLRRMTEIQQRYPLHPESVDELWSGLHPPEMERRQIDRRQMDRRQIDRPLEPGQAERRRSERRSSGSGSGEGSDIETPFAIPPGMAKALRFEPPPEPDVETPSETPLAIPLAMARELARKRPAAEVHDLRPTPRLIPEKRIPEKRVPERPARRRQENRPDDWGDRTLMTAAGDEPATLTVITPPPTLVPPSRPPAGRTVPLLLGTATGAALILLALWRLQPSWLPRLDSAPSKPARPSQAHAAPPAAIPTPVFPATNPVPLPAEDTLATSVAVSEATTAPLPEASSSPPTRKPPRPMKEGDMILHGEPGAVEPEIKFFPPYSYPAADRGSGRKGTLRVAVLVDETGAVLEARLQGTPGDPALEQTALETARKARFFPPLRNGIAGKMWTELLFTFAEPAPAAPPPH